MSIGQELIGSLKEAAEHAAGRAAPVRETTVNVPQEVDVKRIRERLGLSQEEFALRFGFSIGTLRHWEQGRRFPEGPARTYLKVIDRDPEAVERALAVG